MDNKTLAGIDHVGDLRAFVRVADACNFTLAAERLGLTRSAVGKCVARLEAGLGVRLLHRSTRSVSLSDEGRLFYEHAARILSEVDNAAGAMARRKQTPRGRCASTCRCRWAGCTSCPWCASTWTAGPTSRPS